MNKTLISIGSLCGVTVLSGTMLGRIPDKAAADVVSDVSVTMQAELDPIK